MSGSVTQDFSDEARIAVREAIAKLLRRNKRAQVQSVPTKATELLVKEAAGRLTDTEAWDLVMQAIERMVQDGELSVSDQPYDDWKLLR